MGNNIKKTVFYRWVKVSGLLSFIPFVLVAGPMAGYFLGDYLVKHFKLHDYVTYIFIGVGIIGSLRETIKIIKLALKTSQQGDS